MLSLSFCSKVGGYAPDYVIVYFENVYRAINELWFKCDYSRNDKKMFFHTCYLLGFCYSEMHLYQKALFYLELIYALDFIKYKIEYCNCLVNSQDFRTLTFIHKELNKFENKKNKNLTEEEVSYYQFLLRRNGYVLIEMGKLDEAENLFKKILDIDKYNGFAKDELDYIKELRKRKQ